MFPQDGLRLRQRPTCYNDVVIGLPSLSENPAGHLTNPGGGRQVDDAFPAQSSSAVGLCADTVPVPSCSRAEDIRLLRIA